jgi:serine/threonine protein phosphatase PrpC
VVAGDAFMLCTDGLWEHLEDAVLEACLAGAATPRAWLDALDTAVRDATRGLPSHDNYTALAVWSRAA